MNRAWTITAACALSAALAGPTFAAPPAPPAPPVDPASAAALRGWSVFFAEDLRWQGQAAPLADWVTEPEQILGVRYSTFAPGMPREPRVMPTFDDVCGAVDQPASGHRVGIVIDYGRPEDTAGGDSPGRLSYTCAIAETGATVAAVLSGTVMARIEGDQVCAVETYPETGCVEFLGELTPAAALPDAPLSPAELPQPPEQGSVTDTGAVPGGGASGPAAGDAEATTSLPRPVMLGIGLGAVAMVSLVVGLLLRRRLA